MEFKDVVVKRQSVREYTDQPVPDDRLRRVLEAARLAPSGGNRQAWKFVVVKDPGTRQKLSQACNNQAFVGQAPVVIAAVATNPERVMMCGVPSYAIDMGIAMEHVALAAADEGLGTCWIGAFSQEQVRKILGVPDKYTVAAVMPLGYPTQLRDARPRKPFEEVFCFEKFTE